MRDDRLLLDVIVRAVERLVELGNGSSASRLAEDRALGEQVLYNLIVLGEAAKTVSVELRLMAPDVDWRAMATTRDRLVHHYEGTDWEVVAEIITTDLPPMVPRLRAIRDEAAV